jgi:hypothetical protein
MIITAWVLLVLFSMFSVRPTIKWVLHGELNMNTLYAMFFSYFVVAVSAGIIWGGLFKQFNS